MAERPALGFWVFWVVDIFTSSLGERAVACRDALRSSQKDGVSQDFPTDFAKSQASLGSIWTSRAPSESGSTITILATNRLQCVGHFVYFLLQMTLRATNLASLVSRSRIFTNLRCGPSRRYLSSSPQHDPLRVLFCGADEFSIYSLRAINKIKKENPDKVASIDVVCRKDKRVGRGLKQIREGKHFCNINQSIVLVAEHA